MAASYNKFSEENWEAFMRIEGLKPCYAGGRGTLLQAHEGHTNQPEELIRMVFSLLCDHLFFVLGLGLGFRVGFSGHCLLFIFITVFLILHHSQESAKIVECSSHHCSMGTQKGHRFIKTQKGHRFINHGPMELAGAFHCCDWHFSGHCLLFIFFTLSLILQFIHKNQQ